MSTDDTLRRLKVKKPHPGPFGWLVQLVGWVVILLAILTGVTIVGLPLAFFMGVGGMIFVNLGRGYARVTCPVCGKKTAIPPTAENLTCKKCKQLTLVDWS